MVAQGLTKVQRTFCFGLAFAGGFNVMLLELCAFRVLQTTFGSSVYVTGVLLALIMIALSLGYYLGGFFSARMPKLVFIFGLLLVCVGYVHLSNRVFVESILDYCFDLRRDFASNFKKHLIPTALATGALYFVPMLALSQISPFLIQIMSHREQAPEAIGKTAGKLMAISTIGSIIGTLIPSFALLPYVGVQNTLLVFQVSVVAIVLVGWPLFGRVRRLPPVVASLLALFLLPGAPRASAAQAKAHKDETLIRALDSHYGNIRVYRNDKTGDLTYHPSRVYTHTQFNPDNAMATAITLEFLGLMPVNKAKRVLVLGTALGAVLSQLVEIDPTAQVTGVEIDPKIIELSKELAPQLNRPNVRLVAEDARLYLKETREEFDYVIVDLFAGGYLPLHCVTEEFFELISKRLSPDGIVFVNSNMKEFTELQDPAVWTPVRHLYSAVSAAGFASMFKVDLWRNGHFYATKRARPLAAVREELRRSAEREELPPEYRATLAYAYLTARELHPDPKAFRPFTDAWSPEHLIQVRANRDEYLAAALKRGETDWSTIVHAKANEKPLDIARYGLWSEAVAEKARQQKSDESWERYCRDFVGWAARSDEPLAPQLSLYLGGSESAACSEIFQTASPPVERTPRVAGFVDLADGSSLLAQDHAKEALPILLRAMKNTAFD